MHPAGAREAEMSGTADIPQDSVRSKEKMASKAGTAPRKRPLGTAWRDGSHMTIPMTTMYELNPATGQVAPMLRSPVPWTIIASSGACPLVARL